MKTITNVKTVEEIVGYEACDGTRFTTMDECEKYENTAKAVIKSRFKKLVIKEIEGINLTKEGIAYIGAGIDEDWYYALVEIKDENDLRAAQMYHEIEGCKSGKYGFDETMIGKRVLVGIGSGKYPRPEDGSQCEYNNSYVYGTIEEQIKKFEEAIRQFEKVDEE